jgi:hypothetical protein
MTLAPKRRWSYSLRTLFVVVTVVGCWLGYELNWIRERHEFVNEQEGLRRAKDWRGEESGPRASANAPDLLWLFGEQGIGAFGVLIAVDRLDQFDDGFDWQSHETMRTARHLFPEATVVGFGVVERERLADQ